MGGDDDKIRAVAREEAENACADHAELCEARRQVTVDPYSHWDDHGLVSWLRKNMNAVASSAFRIWFIGIMVLTMGVGIGLFAMYAWKMLKP